VISPSLDIGMKRNPPLTIVNVGYLSTNYWVVSAGHNRILIDLGYPGTMGTMVSRMDKMDVPLGEIRYAIATHYHIDHAGLGQELKQAGVTLLVLESQEQAIPQMKPFTKPRDHYVEIVPEGNKVITFAEGRGLLEQIGIAGGFLSTPGHSADSISVLLDEGQVFTGDLPPYLLAWEDEKGRLIKSCWKILGEHGAKTIYPAHGPIRPMDPGIKGTVDTE
jgi:endoribonuclease LACTB2